MSIVNGFLTLKMKTVHFRLSDLASLEHGLERWLYARLYGAIELRTQNPILGV